MPHRLRRVIGVNLYAPKLPGPSGCFAELNTRGAVAVSGANGVGKTSFLRLLPLFYGAQPRRLLRSSGHLTLVRHTLPEASSAVVFEYERATQDDICCAVMFCHPSEDAPVFLFVRGEFKEDWFVTSTGQMVTLEDFNKQVESTGSRASEQLRASEYRSVILGERAKTQEMAKLQRMSREFSLAPRSLQGLEHIAEAMGPEALSFGALKEIVVKRAKERMGLKDQDGFQLKKDVKDVLRWLSDQHHLTQVQARAEASEQLAFHCREIEQHDLAMRQLRASTRSVLRRTRDALEEAKGKEAAARSDAGERLEILQRAREEARRGAGTAQQDASAQEMRVNSIRNRQAEYVKLNAEEKERQAANEPALQEQAEALQGRLRLLNQAHQDIQNSYHQEARESEARCSAASQRVGSDREVLQQQHARRTNENHEAELQALADLSEPARLAEVRREIEEAVRQDARLAAEERNPGVPEASTDALGKTRERLSAARIQQQHAQHQHTHALQEQRSLERDRQAKLLEAQQAQHRVETARAVLVEISSRLAPKAGSLLEYLRATNPADLTGIAKVLHPDLLDRTDLQPQCLPEAASEEHVQVGSVVLDVRQVQPDAWLDAVELRREHGLAQRRLEEEEGRLKAARADAEAANTRVQEGEQRITVRASELETRTGSVERLQRQVSDQEATIQQLAQHARQTAAEALQELRQRAQALGDEKQDLERQHQDARAALQARFQRERAELQQEVGRQSERLDRELADAKARAAAELQQLEQVRAGQLVTAGVDPREVLALEQELGELKRRLSEIAGFKHELGPYRHFRYEVLPTLAGEEEKLRNLVRRAKEADAAVTAAIETVTQHEQQSERMLDELGKKCRALDEDVHMLESMLQRELARFADNVTEPEDPTHTCVQLGADISKHARALAEATNNASTIAQSLRATMTASPGPAADWLVLREASEPMDPKVELPPHMNTARKGQLLRDWFETGSAPALDRLNKEFLGICNYVQQHVRSLHDFESKIVGVNQSLSDELKKIQKFPGFDGLHVKIKSAVGDIKGLDDLQAMADRAGSRVSRSYASDAREARHDYLPSKTDVELMRRFRDQLTAGEIGQGNFSDLVKLVLELNVEGRRLEVSREDEFRLYASTGNTGMITAMFLMGFAGMVRTAAGADVRLTWITDEFGKYDAPNLHAFLRTLHQNNIDLITAAPMTNTACLDMFDRSATFALSGAIKTLELQEGEYAAV